MDDSEQKTQRETQSTQRETQTTQSEKPSTQDDPSVVAPPKSGTVTDVRPPTVDPKELPDELKEILKELNPLQQYYQEGKLEDTSTKEEKTFISSCSDDLEVGDPVRYKDLQHNPRFKAIVIC